MIIKEDVPQQSEEWFRMRKGRPTASQFFRIYTAGGKDSSQWEAYATELVTECIRPDEIPAFTGNKHTDRGNELEPEARALFSELTGFETKEVAFITRDDGVVGCSPDALVLGPDGEPFAGLEIKCPMAKNHAETLLSGVMPTTHKPQVHGGMAVTGLKKWFFLSYCPGFRPLLVETYADAYTASLSDALDRFLIFYSAHRKKILPILTGKL